MEQDAKDAVAEADDVLKGLIQYLNMVAKKSPSRTKSDLEHITQKLSNVTVEMQSLLNENPNILPLKSRMDARGY